MVYQADIPDPNDLISISQGEIKDNFTALNVGFAIDHYAYDVADAGKHKKITYQAPLVADPGLASPIASLYTKTIAGKSQLFFQNGALATDAVQLTTPTITTVGNDNSITTPWGIKIKWGRFNGNNSTAVTFAGVGANAFTAVPALSLGREGAAGSTVSYSVGMTVAGFTAVASGPFVGTYIAIGV